MVAACDVYDALPPHENSSGGSSGGAGSSGVGGTTGSDGSTAGAGRGGLGAQAGAGPSTGGGGSSATGGTAGTTPGDGAVGDDAPPGDSSVGGAAGSTTGGGAGTAGTGGFSGAGGAGGLSGAAGTTDGSSTGGSSAGTDAGPSRGGNAGVDAGQAADTNMDNDGHQDVDASLDGTPRDGPVDADASDDADVDAGNCAGYAFNFTGANYATLTRPVQDDFTLEAWVKTSSSLTGVYHYEGRGLIHGDVSGNANDFGASILNSKFAFGVGNPDTTVQGGTTVTTGQWMHVAATRQRSTGEIRVIVNGSLDGSLTPAQTNSLTAPSALTLGGNTIDGRYFIGYVDELRIWNVVRTPAEISSTMNQRLNGSEPGLVSYFRFDEGSGTVAVDSSSRAVNAALNGSPAWVPSDAPICSPAGDP